MNWYKKAKKNKCSGWMSVRFNHILSRQVQNWGRKHILEENIYNKEGFGREDDTHITIIYGICTDNIDIIKDILKDIKPIKAIMKKVGFFKSDENYDVIIIKIESKDLEELNKKINLNLKVDNTYSEYKPHCTIAYVKKGTAMRYAGDTFFDGTKITFNKIVFMDNKDKEIIINL